MKILGKKNHPFLGEIDDVEIEETDFDFRIQFEDLDINKKADFLSFLKMPMLPREKDHPLYLKVVEQWGYYNVKHWGYFVTKENTV